MKTSRFFVPHVLIEVEDSLKDIEGAYICEEAVFTEGQEQHYNGTWVTPINTEERYVDGAIQFLCSLFNNEIHFVVKEPSTNRVVWYPNDEPDYSKYEELGINKNDS